MKWNVDLYQSKHDFVSDYGKELLQYLDHNDKKILDLGCGPGIITNELYRQGKNVIGIDHSQEMLDKARQNYPLIPFYLVDACQLIWTNEFDAILSNAVFHWIQNQTTLLAQVYSALKNNGKLVCEFGAKNNVGKIQKAFTKALKQENLSYSNPFFLPSTEEYTHMLEHAGFQVEWIQEFDRPTPLADGEKGLENWVKQFFAAYILKLSSDQQEKILRYMENTLSEALWDGQQWNADYRRLRVIARKKY